MCLSKNPKDPWKSVWVAGFTSKTEDPSRSLAYLMCVEASFPNQYALWHGLSSQCRNAKLASRSPIGDVFKSRPNAAANPHDLNYYEPPVLGNHVHSTWRDPNIWLGDISCWGKKSLPHWLLLGKVGQSYQWPTVKMILKLGVMGATAHHKQFDSLNDFIDSLQEYDP